MIFSPEKSRSSNCFGDTQRELLEIHTTGQLVAQLNLYATRSFRPDALVDAGTEQGARRGLLGVRAPRRHAGGRRASTNADASRVEAILATYRPIDPVARGDYRKEGWDDLRSEGAGLIAETVSNNDLMRANWPG